MQTGQWTGLEPGTVQGRCGGLAAFSYVPEVMSNNFCWPFLQTYAFADDLFQSNQGPSFPAHQYLISGASTVSDGSNKAASNTDPGGLGGCDSPPGTEVKDNYSGRDEPRMRIVPMLQTAIHHE